MDKIEIKRDQKWKEKVGDDIVKVLYASSTEIRAIDMNGSDSGTEMKMKPYDFLKKYKPLNGNAW